MSKWALAGLLAAAGTAWVALARPNRQDDDRRPPSAPLIKLNVAAVDARGQSVADLTREDFQVFDGGKLQPIASFHRNDIKPLHALPHGPNEVSNRSGTPLSRATVILFDLLNARFDDRAYVANQLVPALQHVEASDSLFLHILTTAGPHGGRSRPHDLRCTGGVGFPGGGSSRTKKHYLDQPRGADFHRWPQWRRRNRLYARSEEHTSELQSLRHLVCRL